ncbi:CRISPR-associated helicase/endonuclease Cas3 [Caballeronia zhejiangensis]|uniref:CRISPR-associated helicase/endonuclease Cas3 n=1 Tax=Caballeronia zhejiangensis TaxID=871203 RepID=UPI00052E8D0F|nr:CRISPR-associated helicase/endonuclease Cas3 [Caballeronia zhejiangensis]
MQTEATKNDTCIAWGKRPRDGDEHSPFHPLCDHMLDVAACFMAIARCGRIRDALTSTAGRALSEQDIERLAALTYLHDVGKANSGFQAKRWKGPAPREWPQKAGHGSEALYAFSCDEALLAGLPIEAMSNWAGGVDELLHASLGHHGRPIPEPKGVDPLIWRPVRDASGHEIYRPANALKQIGDALRRHFPLAFASGGEPLPSTPSFVHLFAGLVQLADWLGSDTRFFEYSEPGSARTLQAALERASRAVGAIGLETSALRAQLIRDGFSFQSAFGIEAPHATQSALGEEGLGPLLVLESETGSGKTEAALWRFAKLFEAGKVDSLYFALPTRVAATQVYERVRKFVARLWPTYAPVTVRALPGYESADGNEKSALPDFKVLWSDHPDETKAHQRWAAESSKRFLAATIAVGTIDQALLAALQMRHAHLRHAALCRSLLVVDEVHASDTYMSQVLEQLLEAHRTTGGHALLLSATLGSSQRARFQSIANGGKHVSAPGIETAADAEYPALTDGTSIKKLRASGEPKTIHWQTLNAIDDHARVARLAFDAAKQGARVLIVRNTVPAAIATQKAVEALVNASGDRAWLFDIDGVPTLHHSRFSRQDRPRLDARVEERMGKIRNGVHACIVVGTQTLEQSLDIDADMLITDICPMDVLLQRIGRLHRHKPEGKDRRPDGFERARAWVLIPESGSFEACLDAPRNGLGRLKNGGGVYPDLRMIEATRRLISEKPSRMIPLENRELVERATHPDCLRSIQQELDAAWEQQAQQLEGGKGAERTIARLHALPYDAAFAKLAFPEGEERIATRLGAVDKLVEFDPPELGPFGEDVRQIAMRFHMLPNGLDADATPISIIRRDDGGFEFDLGAARYSYRRFGVEKIGPRKS